MSEILHQEVISETDNPVWKDIFNEREYKYLSHAVNGLIQFGEIDYVSIQFGQRNSTRVFHIFEPFTTLNFLGFASPSVVSISFSNGCEIRYSTGHDNGLEIFSNEVTLVSCRQFPKNSMLEIDFWHFVDAIGIYHIYDV